MPFLHLDLPIAVSASDRERVAGRLARLYADSMQTRPEEVTVAFRELGENGVLSMRADGQVWPVVVVQLDIRRGRPPEQRERLAAAIAALLEEELDWPTSRTILEFTQHSGDEFWDEQRGLGADWTPDEASAHG
jgi:phenylpyruvate tautomerase PptA (4-oxalocrotonate tautomerase family)